MLYSGYSGSVNDFYRKQRYRVSDTHYRPGGPAFLMIGGEGPANAAWMVAGTWIQAKKQTNDLHIFPFTFC